MPYLSERRLAGKTAVVTGGAGGIGAVSAELFIEAGARVMLVDKNADLLASTCADLRARLPHAQVEARSGDVAEYQFAQQVVADTVRWLGSIDVLVCNAAIRHVGPIETAEADDWKRLLDVNLLGSVNFCRAAAPELRKSASGSVIIVSSCYAVVARKQMPIYDATKAALLSVVRSFAAEMADANVRVNGVCPGGTITPYTVSRNQELGKTEEAMRSEPKTNSLLGRFAEPIEVAYPILWLASDEASYLTGAAIMVDGGLSAM